VEHADADAWSDHGHARHTLRDNPERFEETARIQHDRKHRDHIRRARLGAGVQGEWHGVAGGVGFYRRAFPCIQSFSIQEPFVLWRGAVQAPPASATSNVSAAHSFHARTAFVFLGACLAISALPPLNGFVSEWLVFQAVLLSPSLPQWSLKLLVPAVGVALALSAALCAGCFVRAYGVAFLGRARSIAPRMRERRSLVALAMSGLLALCLLAGLFPSYMIDTITPAAKLFVGGHVPTQGDIPWMSIVPIAESRSSYNGLLVFVFIIFSASVAALIVRRFGSKAIRRGPAWIAAIRPEPATQYTGSSFRSADPPNPGMSLLSRRPSGYAAARRHSSARSH